MYPLHRRPVQEGTERVAVPPTKNLVRIAHTYRLPKSHARERLTTATGTAQQSTRCMTVTQPARHKEFRTVSVPQNQIK